MDHEAPIALLLGGGSHPRESGLGDDEVIARLAERQHGIVWRSQLRRLAVGSKAIERRLEAARLHRVHPGVYAVGHRAMSFEARAIAAVAALPRLTVATARTALALRGVGEAAATIDVATRHPRTTLRGVRIRGARLREDEWTLVRGIPCATAERALLDVSGSLPPPSLRRLVKQAEFERIASVESIGALLDRYPRRQGRRALADLIENELGGGATPTRSELEDRFAAFLRRRSLPLPETNFSLLAGGRRYEVDCVWLEQGLIVELDGAQAHRSASAFEGDRARDRALVASGYVVIRITWSQLHADPSRLERELRAALLRSGHRHRNQTPIVLP